MEHIEKNHPYQNQLWKERLDDLKASGLMNQIRENIKVNKKTGADEDMIVINAVDRAVFNAGFSITNKRNCRKQFRDSVVK